MQSKFFYPIILFTILLVSCNQNNKSLKYTTLQYNDSIYDKDINLNYLFTGEIQLPTIDNDSIDSNIIHDSIISNLLGKNFSSYNGRRALKVYSDSTFNQISRDITDNSPYFDDNNDSDLSYQHIYKYHLKGEIRYAQDSIIFYRSTLNSYTGGAHGMVVVTNYIFNSNTGKQLNEDDIFVSSYKIELHNLLIKYACEQYPQEIFFDKNLLVPNGNISLTTNGIVYTYNPYDVAPYCNDVINVIIPFEELQNITDSTTLLGRYIGDNFTNNSN